jgi:hypothetical protein
MDSINVKYAPAINDLTSGDIDDDQGMEAVLFDSKGQSIKSQRDGGNLLCEKKQDLELLEVIKKRQWPELMYRVQTQPHIAYVKFVAANIKTTSAGNLVLHEVCKQNPPVDVVETLFDANELAVISAGYGGYLPLHHACAYGASDEVIKYLVSKYPEALSVEDDHDHALPLHLVSKIGASEDVFMVLLTHYPHAAKVKDDFGNLPIDYAKSIRNDNARKVAIDCLARSRWLTKAAEYSKQETESEYQHRIRGYEESQAKHLKTIQEFHEEELAELEKVIESQKEELSVKTTKIEEVEKGLAMKTKELESTAMALNKAQVALDAKLAEVSEISQKLQEVLGINELLSQRLDKRTVEYETAIDDVEILNKHAEWLESILSSIRQVANTESPTLAKSLHQRENQMNRNCVGETSTSSRRSSPRFVPGPASKKFATSIPRYGDKDKSNLDTMATIPIRRAKYPDYGDDLQVADSRSEACDSDLQSILRDPAD